MDETPMQFEMPSSWTLEFSGSRTVPMKSCVAENADGKKLPAKVIFKGVRIPRDLFVPESVRVSFHKKGWMGETGVKEWIQGLFANYDIAVFINHMLLVSYITCLLLSPGFQFQIKKSRRQTRWPEVRADLLDFCLSSKYFKSSLFWMN